MKDKTYRIAIRKRDNDFFWEKDEFEFTEFKPSNLRYWQADPFLFEKDNITYLFFESFDRIRRKGTIACSIISDEGISEPKEVISEDIHLSFPYVFMVNDDVYMIPETCESKSIRLYKAVDFPWKWEKHTLIKDIFSCDTILLFNREKIIGLITSGLLEDLPDQKLQSCYVENSMYLFDSGFPNVSTEKHVLISGDYGVRNAGSCFEYQGKLIRPGQDCTNNRYGYGIVFWEIQSLNHYCEKEFMYYSIESLKKHINKTENAVLLGSHTCNLSSQYEVIDYSYMDILPNGIAFRTYIYRFYFYIKIRARSLYRKLLKYDD